MGEFNNWSPYLRDYDPLKAGSIDGTDNEPHDRAITRAINSHYQPPSNLKSYPLKTLFVSRLNPRTSRQDLIAYFSSVGEVKTAKIIVDVVTGQSQGYGFVEMASDEAANRAIRKLNDSYCEGVKIFVDHELGRTMKNWKPRRLGGGFGGKKESGQLRFGGKIRPFKKPIIPYSRKN